MSSSQSLAKWKANISDEGGIISVQPMRFLAEARRPDDDWNGLTARSERKKRQNRLNQRAYRRRKDSGTATSRNDPPASRRASNLSSSQPSQVSRPKTRDQFPIDIFSPNSHKEYRFPLSTDHLMLLVQYNLYRACLTNMEVLNIKMPHLLTLTVPTPNTPPSFTPTYLQRSVMHPAWIDSIPAARLRDNFIRQCGSSDADEFWFDAVGDLHEAYEKPLLGGEDQGKGKERTFQLGDEFSGLMCWSDPWRIESYEISPTHLKKWWRLHEGCEELIRGTNWWRGKRGEDPIVLEEMVADMSI